MYTNFYFLLSSLVLLSHYFRIICFESNNRFQKNIYKMIYLQGLLKDKLKICAKTVNKTKTVT